MDSNHRPETLKRRRSDSSSPEDVSEDCSKAWNDPTLLEEMGLGLLGSDVYTSDEDEIKKLLDSPSLDSDNDCENMGVTKDKEGGVERKKRKLNKHHREPLREQQVIVNSETEESPQPKEDDSVKLEKLKPSNCVIKNSQVTYGKEKIFINEADDVKDECVNINNTEQVCSEFKLSRLSIKNKDVVSGIDYFSQLPEEIILTILKKLDRRSVVRCCQVSRHLNRVASQQSLWSRVDLGGRRLPPSALGYMMLREPFIVRLASACILDPVSHPKLLPKNFTCRIQYLDLSMTTISQSSLSKFLGYCTRLKKLSIENCAINNEVAVSIAGNRGLEVLNLAMCTGITMAGLTKILSQCTRLQSLNLGWTNLSPSTINMVARKLPSTVERLNISGCRRNITDQHVIDILERCDNLLELDLSDCIDLTERSIEYIVKHGSGLEYLAVSRCYSIPLDCFLALNEVGSLSYLDLFGLCTESELKKLRSSLKDITLNQFTFSSVARPTVGLRRTSIWGLRVRD